MRTIKKSAMLIVVGEFYGDKEILSKESKDGRVTLFFAEGTISFEEYTPVQITQDDGYDDDELNVTSLFSYD